MRVGTKSVLFGAHAIWMHGWYVGLAWRKLYGFPWDPRLWFAFVLHDVGYLFKPNMDGPEGETHVELGAKIMRVLFGSRWGEFCAAHSRYWAKARGIAVSKLCVADKLAFVLTPDRLYLRMTKATGELYEYMERARQRQAGVANFEPWESECLRSSDPEVWLMGLKSYTQRWVEEHCDGRADLWTVADERSMRVFKAGF